MSLATRWLILLAACGAVAVALQRRRTPRNSVPTLQAKTAALNEWENEGGNAAPAEHASGERPG